MVAAFAGSVNARLAVFQFDDGARALARFNTHLL